MITAIHKVLADKREAVKKGEDEGFTLIELLVVILIIGILTAIAIPVFLGQQNEAKDAAAKSDLANLKVAVQSYATAHNGIWPTEEVFDSSHPEYAELQGYGAVTTTGVTAHEIVQADSAGLCLTATSATNNVFYITGNGGASTTACP